MKKQFGKGLSLLLTVSMLLTMLPAFSLGANAEDVIELASYSDWSTYLGALESGDSVSVKLVSNITRKAKTNIPTGASVTIDLNGFTYKSSYETATNVIEVAGVLTIKDTGSGAGAINGNGVHRCIYVNGGTFTLLGGTLKNGKKDGNGGGVYVSNKGSFTMSGGSITDCTATTNSTTKPQGGGVYNSGIFNMTAGTITGCKAEATGEASAWGGGVFNSGTFTMSGGEITGCSVTKGTGSSLYGYGGGVYTTGSFTMSSGSISDCTSSTANGRAVYVGASGSLSVSGDAVVISDKANPIYKISSVDKEKLQVSGGWYSESVSDHAALTVSGTATGECADAPNSKAPYTVKTNGSEYTVTYNKNNESTNEMTLTVGETPHAETSDTTAVASKTTLPTAALDGFNFKGWNTQDDGEGTSYDAGAAIECAEGLTLYAQWEDASAPNVALNSTNYPTIAAALDAASAGDTLTLLVDLSENVTITAGKSVTLDLNGKTLSAAGEGATITVEEGASLTIADTEGTGTIDAVQKGYAILNQGTLTVNGGTIINGKGTYGAAIRNEGTATIEDVTVRDCAGTAVYSAKDKNSSTTINGGKFYCEVNKGTSGAEMVINGGWFKSEVKCASPDKYATGECADAPDAEAPYTVASTEKYTINYLNTDDSVVISAHNPTRGTQVSLKSKTDNTKETDKTVIAWYLSKELTGTYYEPGDKVEFFAATTTLYAQWGTREAQIGTTVYEHLADAIGAADTNETTIKLLCDVTTNTVIPQNANITLNLNGYTLKNNGTEKSKTIEVKSDASLTVTDTSESKTGTIDGNGVGYGIYSYGTLTISGGTITNCKAGGNGSAVYNNRGTLNITGGIIENCDYTETTAETTKSYNTIHNYGTSKAKAACNISDGTIGGTIGTSNTMISVTGGTFSVKPSVSWIDYDYRAVGSPSENPTEWTITSREDGAVKIGGESYRSISRAAEVAAEDAVIVLQRDQSENVVIPAGAKLTLDLNGYKLTSEDRGATVSVEPAAVLTVTDSSEGKTGTIDGNGMSRGIRNGGTTTMAGGTIQNCKYSYESGTNAGKVYNGGCVHNVSGGSFTMTGGTIIATVFGEGEVIYIERVGTDPTEEGYVGAKSFGRGSAVFVSTGSFTLDGGTVVGDIARETQAALNDENAGEQLQGTVTVIRGYVSEQNDVLNDAQSSSADLFTHFIGAAVVSDTAAKQVGGVNVYAVTKSANAIADDYRYVVTDSVLTVYGRDLANETLWIACYKDGQMLSVGSVVVNSGEGVTLAAGADSVKIFGVGAKSFEALRDVTEVALPE